MNGEISAEEWEATLQELSDAQVAETAANENYEAAAAGRRRQRKRWRPKTGTS